MARSLFIMGPPSSRQPLLEAARRGARGGPFSPAVAVDLPLAGAPLPSLDGGAGDEPPLVVLTGPFGEAHGSILAGLVDAGARVACVGAGAPSVVEGMGTAAQAFLSDLYHPGFVHLLGLVGKGRLGTVERILVERVRMPDEAPLEDVDGVFEALLAALAAMVDAPLRVGHLERDDGGDGRPRKEGRAAFEGGPYARVRLDLTEASARFHRITVEGTEATLRWWRRPQNEELFYVKDGSERRVKFPRVSPADHLWSAVMAWATRGASVIETPALLRRLDALGRALSIPTGEVAVPGGRRRFLLVKAPRFRQVDDHLELPALGIARLKAYLDETEYRVDLDDLDIRTRRQGVDLTPFLDGADVDAFLDGGEPSRAIVTAVDAMVGMLDVDDRTIFGVSILDFYERYQLNIAFCLSRRLRERFPGILVVLGGDSHEVDGGYSLGKGAWIDYVVDGDAEVPLLGLARHMDLGDRELGEVPGLWYRGEGGAVVKQRQHHLPMKERPLPTYEGVPLHLYRAGVSGDLAHVLGRHGLGAGYDERHVLLPYFTVKGCCNQCAFCSFGNYLDLEPVGKAVDHLERIRDTYEERFFFFLDTTINVTYRRLSMFIEALLARNLGILWSDSARPHVIDDDLARGMREAGCVMLSYGVESGSDAILGRMNKGFTADEVEQTLQAVHRAGIVNRVNLIAGFFHETDEDVAATVSFIDRNHEAIHIIGCFQGFYLIPTLTVDETAMGIRPLGYVDRLIAGQETVAYEEVGGLAWPDKKSQIQRSHESVTAALVRNGVYVNDKVNDLDLFHLHAILGDGARARTLFLESSRREFARIQASKG